MWKDSDDEEEVDENAHWNANTHRAFTGGPNGGIDVEQMSKLPHMKHAFRTVDVGMGGGGTPDKRTDFSGRVTDLPKEEGAGGEKPW